jgi:diphthamide biosynthesis enzyme Dph1/Dph2-like protein
MDTLFIKARWTKEIKLNEQALEYFKGKKSVALFASVQFLNLGVLIKQLEDLGLEVRRTYAKRASEEGQILGCDVYADAFEEKIIKDSESILYVGDGMFHPQALLLSQVYGGITEVVVWNPVDEKMKILKEDEIEEKAKKLKANLNKFVIAKVVGIIVSTKPGQQFLDSALKLKDKLKDKEVYVFLDDKIDLLELENFPFIECWVNTACPRIVEDKSEKPIVNIKEALDPLKYLDKLAL